MALLDEKNALRNYFEASTLKSRYFCGLAAETKKLQGKLADRKKSMLRRELHQKIESKIALLLPILEKSRLRRSSQKQKMRMRGWMVFRQNPKLTSPRLERMLKAVWCVLAKSRKHRSRRVLACLALGSTSWDLQVGRRSVTSVDGDVDYSSAV